MGTRIRVEQTDPPTTKVVLAEAVVRIGEAAKALSDSGLNEKAIVVLLQDKTKVGKHNIQIVLDGLKQLESWYCKR